jgi:hypothetical protein
MEGDSMRVFDYVVDFISGRRVFSVTVNKKGKVVRVQEYIAACEPFPAMLNNAMPGVYAVVAKMVEQENV